MHRKCLVTQGDYIKKSMCI